MKMPQEPIDATLIDGAVVRQAIAQVKQALADTYPDKKVIIDNHPCWS